IGGFEQGGAGGNELHAPGHQRYFILDENGVEAGIAFGGDTVVAEGQAAQRELFAIEGIDAERLFEFSEVLAATAEDHLEVVRARGDFELVLVMDRFLLKFLHLVLGIEIKFDGRSEERRVGKEWRAGWARDQ